MPEGAAVRPWACGICINIVCIHLPSSQRGAMHPGLSKYAELFDQAAYGRCLIYQSTAPHCDQCLVKRICCTHRYKFKVVLCNRHCDHDWDTCPFAHIGEDCATSLGTWKIFPPLGVCCCS